MNRLAALAGGGVAVALIAVGVGLYVERGRVAESAARRWLTEHGVAASAIHVEGLSPDRLTARVRLGEAGDPDLTVEHMELRYDLLGPWSGSDLTIAPRTVRLDGLHLKARLTHGVLAFGAVDDLIKAIQRLPPSKSPAPGIELRDGEVRIFTDGGVVRLRIAGDYHVGAPSSLQGKIAPFHLVFDGRRFDGLGGALNILSDAERFEGHVDLLQAAYAGPGGSIQIRHMQLSTTAPAPGGHGVWRGPASARLEAEGLVSTLAGTMVKEATFAARFDGETNIGRDRQSLSGDARIGGKAASLNASGVAMQGAALQATISRFSLVNDPLGMVARASARAKVTVDAIASSAGQLKEVSSVMFADRIDVRASGAGVVASGGVLGDLAARAHVSGPGGDGPYAAAFRRALSDFRLSASRWRADFAGQGGAVRLVTPLMVTASSGAHAELAGAGRIISSTPLAGTGAGTLTIAGGGLPSLTADIANAAWARGALTGEVSTQGALDLPPAQGARFAVAGRVNLSGGGGRLDLSTCAPVTIARLLLDPDPVTGVSVRICPAARPLLEATGHGWRAEGRFDGLAGDMPGAAAGLRGGAGSFTAVGADRGLSDGTALVDGFHLVDGSDPVRFKPVEGTGRLDVARGVATGSLRLGTARYPALATISLRHDLTSGEGRADIAARELPFAPGGLQPTDISPIAAAARNARGRASFTGWLAWAPKADLKSGGEAIAREFGFDSPLGPVVGLDADIHFVSLLPLVTAPDQTVNLRQVRAVLPVSLLAARFGLGVDHLTLTTATGAVASGRVRLEPMKIALGSDPTFEGAVLFDHVNLGDVLAATNLSDTVQTNAVVNGRIPFSVGPGGVTIQDGHLAAIGPGRVSISRKALSGVAAGAAGQSNFAQDLAYQAMEDLTFDQMDASIGGQAHDRLGILFHIKGFHDPPVRKKATLKIRDVLSGHAMDKPMTLPSDTKIDLTLDTSLNFGDLVRALAQTWRDALAPVGDTGRSRPVQRPGVTGVSH